MMMWSPTHTVVDSKGKIDLKTTMDKEFTCEIGNPVVATWEVIQSDLIESTYYAAIREKDNDTGESYVFGMVVPICYKDDEALEGREFVFKAIDETLAPNYYDCPTSVLEELSETNNYYANLWRKKCYCKKRNQKRLLSRNRLKKLFMNS